MGQTDIPLNEKGIQQSHDLKNHLKRFKFGRVWSSSLQRASQTSQIINEAFHYPIYDTDLLKERGWGVGEGESHEHFLPDMRVKFDVKNESKEEKIPEGAESYKAFERRVILAFKKILVPSGVNFHKPINSPCFSFWIPSVKICLPILSILLLSPIITFSASEIG